MDASKGACADSHISLYKCFLHLNRPQIPCSECSMYFKVSYFAHALHSVPTDARAQGCVDK